MCCVAPSCVELEYDHVLFAPCNGTIVDIKNKGSLFDFVIRPAGNNSDICMPISGTFTYGIYTDKGVVINNRCTGCSLSFSTQYPIMGNGGGGGDCWSGGFLTDYDTSMGDLLLNLHKYNNIYEVEDKDVVLYNSLPYFFDLKVGDSIKTGAYYRLAPINKQTSSSPPKNDDEDDNDD
jgi:hypothetical protein